MPTEEHTNEDTFQLGQNVFDSQGDKIGKVQARFNRYALVERGGLFLKTYYIPHAIFSKSEKSGLFLSLTKEELRERGYNQVPNDLYEDVPERSIPQIFSGVPRFAKRPLSPAQTGHYSYGRRSPGMNTDAAGSYHRDEVLPSPQRLVESTEEDHRRP